MQLMYLNTKDVSNTVDSAYKDTLRSWEKCPYIRSVLITGAK